MAQMLTWLLPVICEPQKILSLLIIDSFPCIEIRWWGIFPPLSFWNSVIAYTVPELFPRIIDRRGDGGLYYYSGPEDFEKMTRTLLLLFALISGLFFPPLLFLLPILFYFLLVYFLRRLFPLIPPRPLCILSHSGPRSPPC